MDELDKEIRDFLPALAQYCQNQEDAGASRQALVQSVLELGMVMLMEQSKAEIMAALIDAFEAAYESADRLERGNDDTQAER